MDALIFTGLGKPINYMQDVTDDIIGRDTLSYPYETTMDTVECR